MQYNETTFREITAEKILKYYPSGHKVPEKGLYTFFITFVFLILE